MMTLAKIISLIGLGTTVAPCVLYYQGSIGLDAVKTLTLIGTVVWFAATPLWMGRQKQSTAPEH